MSRDKTKAVRVEILESRVQIGLEMEDYTLLRCHSLLRVLLLQIGLIECCYRYDLLNHTSRLASEQLGYFSYGILLCCGTRLCIEVKVQ